MGIRHYSGAVYLYYPETLPSAENEEDTLQTTSQRICIHIEKSMLCQIQAHALFLHSSI